MIFGPSSLQQPIQLLQPPHGLVLLEIVHLPTLPHAIRLRGISPHSGS